MAPAGASAPAGAASEQGRADARAGRNRGGAAIEPIPVPEPGWGRPNRKDRPEHPGNTAGHAWATETTIPCRTSPPTS